MEVNNLRSHFATSKKEHGGRRYAPYAFTEHGAIMLAAVLNTPRVIEVSVFVVRAFVRLREILTTHKALAHKLAELEGKIETHDEAIRSLVSAIRQLMAPPTAVRKEIGFQLRERVLRMAENEGGGNRGGGKVQIFNYVVHLSRMLIPFTIPQALLPNSPACFLAPLL